MRDRVCRSRARPTPCTARWLSGCAFLRSESSRAHGIVAQTPAPAAGYTRPSSRTWAPRSPRGSDPSLTLTGGKTRRSPASLLFANLATLVVDDRRRLSRISARICFPATAGRTSLFPGLCSSEGRRRRHGTAGASLDFANSEQPVLAGSPLAIEAIQKSAMDQRAQCRQTTERHSVGRISLFGH